MKINISQDYDKGTLTTVDPNPLIQFEKWFQEALANITDSMVNAMTLVTSTPNGHPSARIVLLKEFDESGFVFYTNYQSRKGIEIEANSRTALLFWWESLQRQIRVEGIAKKISEGKSDEYFHSRPRAYQVAALTSQQSQIITDEKVLQDKYQSLTQQYSNEKEIIPRPKYWGGYIVVPDQFEFWQGQPNRLHTRFQYTKTSENIWSLVRLSP